MDVRILCLASFLLMGCTTLRPERPASTVADARLCLEAGALRAGQRIRVERRTCEGLACTLDPVARGEVVRVVDERCAIVRVASSAPIRRGDEIALSPPASSATASR
jgi:hypothetical protein